MQEALKRVSLACRKQRADVQNADADRIRIRRLFLRVLRQPMAPELPWRSGDFGRSPFLGSASDKPVLARVEVNGDAGDKEQ